ncbi:MAG: hypothetical protein J6S67_10705 [Methanobrevibacter sp.]|nr:hypothetical protein [Methanobrevibacter sp.]
MSRKEKIYSLYKGDDYLSDGTVKELAKKYNLTAKSLMCTKCPSRLIRQSKQKKPSNAYIIIDPEE